MTIRGWRPTTSTLACALLAGSAAAADVAPRTQALRRQLVVADERVYPPDATTRCHTYPEWSALWWQWVASFPATGHPLSTDGAVDCGFGQPYGSLWFLGGSTSSSTVDRTCAIPADTTLFFPIFNAECSDLEDHLDTPDARAACAAALLDPATVFLTVDGYTVDLSAFRFTSPDFEIVLIADDLFGLTGKGVEVGTVGHSTTNGWYILLRPLPAGDHVLHFGGAITGVFELDVTYHLHVAA